MFLHGLYAHLPASLCALPCRGALSASGWTTRRPRRPCWLACTGVHRRPSALRAALVLSCQPSSAARGVAGARHVPRGGAECAGRKRPSQAVGPQARARRFPPVAPVLVWRPAPGPGAPGPCVRACVDAPMACAKLMACAGLGARRAQCRSCGKAHEPHALSRPSQRSPA
jgi:hypothetical protein